MLVGAQLQEVGIYPWPPMKWNEIDFKVREAKRLELAVPHDGVQPYDYLEWQSAGTSMT
jgi:hypothetical protein